ncbi:hypothetical protein PPERSA_01127 [Pseudocohnilembus persalinus]|uniref:Uncharacterized protein n=1 Tax=Pseudocohnilembus persalinus TaxID=266149 RepID=A0A0V0QV15_PSEPJ|nr:hypothetical protein PPERSA_01127 [Pseudocohnilembus persalinus]|eukprot:KRX06049.1 hypothetical protein PPERSA_01127 [Pseudocohnilembus persalinus]
MQVQKSGLFIDQNNSNQLTQKNQENQNLKRQSQNDVKEKFNIEQNNTNKKQINQILNESHITFSHNPSPKNQIYSDKQSQFINKNLQIIAQEINQQTNYNNGINFNKQKNLNLQKASDNKCQSSLNKPSTSHQFKLTFGENKFNQILDSCLSNNNVEEDLNQQNEFMSLPQKKKQKNQENLISEKLQQENQQNQLGKQIISKNSNTNLKIKKSNQINTVKQQSSQADKNYQYQQKLIQNVDVNQEIKQQLSQIQLQKNDVKDSENPDTPKFASQKADLNVQYKLGQSSLKKYFIDKDNAIKPEEDSQETLIQWQSKQTGVSESMEEASQRTINLSQQGQIKYENRYNKIAQNNNNLTHLSQQIQKSQKVKKTLKELKTNFRDEEQNYQNQNGYYNWNSYQNLGGGNIGISPTQKIKNRPSNLELMENILGGQKQNIHIKHESLHNLESLYSPHSLQYMNNKYRMNQRSYSQQHELDGEDFSPLFSPLAQKKVAKSTKNSIDITQNNGFNLHERINKLPNLGITRSEANSANYQMVSSPQKKQNQNQRQRLRPITTSNIEQQYEQQQERLLQKSQQQVQEQKQNKINNDASKNENKGQNDLKQRKVVRNIILQKQKDVPSVFYEPNSASVKRSQKRHLCLFKNQSSQQQQQGPFSSQFNLQEHSQNNIAQDQRYFEQDHQYKISNTTKHAQYDNNQKFQQFQDIINTQNKSKRSISNQINLRSDVDSLEDVDKFTKQYFSKYHHSSQSKNRKNSFYQQQQELNNENIQSQQGYKSNQNNNILNLIRVPNIPNTKHVQSNTSKFNQENSNKQFERTSLKPHLNIDTIFQKPRLQLEELNNQNISITNQKDKNKKKELLFLKQN